MGSSSGFSAVATFSEVNYFITNFEHVSSHYINLPVGTPHYAFAHEKQVLSWEVETEDVLIDALNSLISEREI